MSSLSGATDRLATVLLGPSAAVRERPAAPSTSAPEFPPEDEGEAALGGERLVARLRLFLAGILFLLALAPGLGLRERQVTLAFNASVLVAAVAFHRWAAGSQQTWIGALASLLDVTLVSAGLLALHHLSAPAVIVGPWVGLYHLAVACAGLRYDWRVCLATGGMAMAQYTGVVFALGSARPGEGLAHLVVLAAMTLVSATVVLRAERLRQLSDTDRLTGLLNRGAFDERLAAEWARSRRYGRPLSLVLLDVDRFKRFNDRHGHAAGDAALRMVAVRLRSLLRATDVAARFGGEEFVLLMPETEAEAALAKTETLRMELARAPIAVGRDEASSHVTVSAGVASWPQDGPGRDDLLARADERLYLAKAKGRNRTVGASAGLRPRASASRVGRVVALREE